MYVERNFMVLTVLWEVTHRYLLDSYWGFGINWYLSVLGCHTSTLKMMAEDSSETLVPVYLIIRRHIPEASYVYTDHRETLKSHKKVWSLKQRKIRQWIMGKKSLAHIFICFFFSKIYSEVYWVSQLICSIVTSSKILYAFFIFLWHT